MLAVALCAAALATAAPAYAPCSPGPCVNTAYRGGTPYTSDGNGVLAYGMDGSSTITANLPPAYPGRTYAQTNSGGTTVGYASVGTGGGYASGAGNKGVNGLMIIEY